MATDDIDEYDDEEAALQEIDQNCSRDKALKALKYAQLYGAKLLTENRKLREDNSNLRASAPKKRRQNEDVFGYKGEVVSLAKWFLLTRAFIIDRASFQKQKPLPPHLTPRPPLYHPWDACRPPVRYALRTPPRRCCAPALPPSCLPALTALARCARARPVDPNLPHTTVGHWPPSARRRAVLRSRLPAFPPSRLSPGTLERDQ
ncbi:hypothetical protein B0H14DRAFT_3467854 [Mycena olivaceomarginata]|nr:hypothetical protein B0H14DRAFT_3467854 [Mycena olivaceomarginata]